MENKKNPQYKILADGAYAEVKSAHNANNKMLCFIMWDRHFMTAYIVAYPDEQQSSLLF